MSDGDWSPNLLAGFKDGRGPRNQLVQPLIQTVKEDLIRQVFIAACVECGLAVSSRIVTGKDDDWDPQKVRSGAKALNY